MDNEFVTFTIGKKKHIALIAHDNEKPKLIEWCKENYDILKNVDLQIKRFLFGEKGR